MLEKVFQECDLNEQKQKVSTFVLIYLGLGVFALLANIVQVKKFISIQFHRDISLS